MKSKTRKYFLQFAIILCVSNVAGLLGAEPDPLFECQSASNSELGDIRGGYVAGGLEVSFGIEKMLAVNGVSLANDSLTFMLGGPAVSTGNMATTVQNGAGNSIDLPGLASLLPNTVTFIQNSLDQAMIQNTTKIDVSVGVRSLYRDLNLTSIMNRQLINSVH